VRLSEHGVAVGDALDRPVETIPNVWVQPGKAAVGGEATRSPDQPARPGRRGSRPTAMDSSAGRMTPGGRNERNDMSEIPGRESALSRDLARVNCALVKIVDAGDRYYVLVGEPELYRDGFRLETTDVLTLSQAEDWCRQEIARQTAAEADSAIGGRADETEQ
jgi:hypothetical protein